MPSRQRSYGFTLIEIMLVLVIMGLVAGYVVVNAFGNDPQDKLKSEAQRFHAVATLASDFAVLNQMEFGLVIDDKRNSYKFVFLDDNDEWVDVPENQAFVERELPEEMVMTLVLDGFEWASEESLFSSGSLFDEQLSVANDSVQIGNEEDMPPPPPQVMFLSSGDLTEFTLQFAFFDPVISDAQFTVSSKGYLPLINDIALLEDAS